jgi:hypothetical protein
MRTLIAALMALLILTVPAHGEQFDSRGVWTPFSSATIAKSIRVTSGIIDVSGMESELCAMIYGATNDDSLNVTFELRGMMSPNIGDTTASRQLLTTTIRVRPSTAGAQAISDTLFGTSKVPYIYARITNADVDSTLYNATVRLFMQPRETGTIANQ